METFENKRQRFNLLKQQKGHFSNTELFVLGRFFASDVPCEPNRESFLKRAIEAYGDRKGAHNIVPKALKTGLAKLAGDFVAPPPPRRAEAKAPWWNAKD